MCDVRSPQLCVVEKTRYEKLEATVEMTGTSSQRLLWLIWHLS